MQDNMEELGHTVETTGRSVALDMNGDILVQGMTGRSGVHWSNREASGQRAQEEGERGKGGRDLVHRISGTFSSVCHPSLGEHFTPGHQQVGSPGPSTFLANSWFKALSIIVYRWSWTKENKLYGIQSKKSKV